MEGNSLISPGARPEWSRDLPGSPRGEWKGQKNPRPSPLPAPRLQTPPGLCPGRVLSLPGTLFPQVSREDPTRLEIPAERSPPQRGPLWCPLATAASLFTLFQILQRTHCRPKLSCRGAWQLCGPHRIPKLRGDRDFLVLLTAICPRASPSRGPQ